MTKSFTKREKGLILILLLILLSAVYYVFFALPSMNRISDAKENTALLQDNIVLEAAKQKKIREMQKKIQEASQREEFKTRIPDYDNLENVMKLLDQFLGSSTEYNLAFSPITEEGSLIHRPIEVEYSCGNYEAALDIIQKIYTSPYKSMIDSISVDNIEYADDDIVNDPVKVTMIVIFIEKKSE
ncbi:hypothetical protein [Anaerotignum sp.]|uniref:hypothetical protein n=1 Tax=Anaerotignum sp. TaxID=2039241 RepID=UPI00271474ED|nr:hypothetical protein [Anaerotignum sp.]